MNGFLFSQAGDEWRDWDPASPLVPSGEEQTRLFAGGERLSTWGSTHGDIHYAFRGGESLMVLSGYITSVSGFPQLTDVQKVVDFLLCSFQRDSSSQALSSLLKSVYGSFGLFYYDFQSGSSICASDRVSSRPLWRHWTGQAWCMSSHANAIALAAPSLEVDLGGLLAFLLYGGPVLPTKSLHAGVEALPPATLLRTFSNGNFREERWRQWTHRPETEASLEDWIDLGTERLKRSASRLAAQVRRPVVFFSGGVDSRLTAVALKSVGCEPLLVTLADSRNLEVSIAEKAAAALKLQHIVMVRDQDWYLRGMPHAVFETGGSFLWSHAHFSPAVARLQEEHGADCFVLGDFCEAFSKLLCSTENCTHHWSVEEFVRDYDQIRAPLYRPRNRDQTIRLLHGRIRSQAALALAHDLEQRHSILAGVSKDPLFLADYCLRWESAATAPTFLMFLDLRSVTRERNLMFDPEVYDLLEIMPATVRDGRNLGALLIKKFDRRVAAVPNANSLLPMSWPPLAHSMSKKCKPLLGKARRYLFGDTYRTTGSWPKKSALYASVPSWRDRFDRLISSQEWLALDLLEPAQVASCWNRLKTGCPDTSSDVEKLAQLSILLESRGRDRRPNLPRLRNCATNSA